VAISMAKILASNHHCRVFLFVGDVILEVLMYFPLLKLALRF
jgi:hypothetical protein